MASRPPAAISQRAERGVALGRARVQRRPEDLPGLVRHEEDGQPAVGHLGRHGHVLLAQRGHPDRDAGAHRVVDDLERLAQPGPLPLGQGDVIGGAVMGERRLAGPDRAADLDDLAGAGQGAVVGHAVEALDDLGARGAEAEDAAAARQGVDAGRRHGDERRRARVDGQDGRADLEALGLGGQVAHEARGVVAVGLGDPDHVEPGLLELDGLAGRVRRAPGVVQRHGQLHAVLPFLCPVLSSLRWRSSLASVRRNDGRPPD